jgi:hypothetical protein
LDMHCTNYGLHGGANAEKQSGSWKRVKCTGRAFGTRRFAKCREKEKCGLAIAVRIAV